MHLVLDNYGTYKHPKVKAWLARRPRWHLHFTQTYASWLNQVERFFALITGQAIRRDSFRSVKQLIVNSLLTTINMPNPSSGPRPPIQSSPSWLNYASVSLGRDTRAV